MIRKSKEKSKSPLKVGKISPDDIYIPLSHVISRKVDENQVVLLDLNKSNRYVELDRWTAKLWQKLNGKRTVSVLMAEITKESKFPETVVRREVMSALRTFSSKNLIERK